MRLRDWFLVFVISFVLFLFMNFWSNKTDREIEEYIRNHPQPLMEMK